MVTKGDRETEKTEQGPGDTSGTPSKNRPGSAREFWRTGDQPRRGVRHW